MKFYLFKGIDNQWRWSLTATNNKKIATSGEGYHNKQDAIHAINLIKQHAAEAPVTEPPL